MRRDTKILASVVATFTTLVLSASALCSWAIAHGASPKWRLLFRMMCHGIEKRCLVLFGVPMPICARCTAIYIGLGIAAAVFFALPSIEERLMRIILYCAAVPMFIDVVTQATGLRESTNGLRIVTGFIAAFAFGIWALTAIEQPHPRAVNPS